MQPLSAVGEGCPDILVGFRARNYLMEIKDWSLPESKKKLTPQESDWHAAWRGQVSTVESINDAFKVLALEGLDV